VVGRPESTFTTRLRWAGYNWLGESLYEVLADRDYVSPPPPPPRRPDPVYVEGPETEAVLQAAEAAGVLASKVLDVGRRCRRCRRRAVVIGPAVLGPDSEVWADCGEALCGEHGLAAVAAAAAPDNIRNWRRRMPDAENGAAGTEGVETT